MSENYVGHVSFNPADYIQNTQIQVSLDKLQKSLDFITIELTALTTVVNNFIKEEEK